MKVLVCGSRHFNDYSLLEKTLDGIQGITKIIEGNARGADSLAADYAHTKSIELAVYPADWNKHGKAAGPIRNIQMLKEAKPELVVAFMAPNSRGTAHMVSIAQKAEIPVEIVNI